jgi:hypothetical protein
MPSKFHRMESARRAMPLTNQRQQRGRYARNNGQFRSCSARLKAGTLLSFSRPPRGHWSEVAVATSVVAVRDGHWVLLHGRPGVLAWIGRAAAFLCIAVYAVTDYVAGIGTGVVMQQSGHLAIRKSRDRLALRRRQRCPRRGCVGFGVGGGRDCGGGSSRRRSACAARWPGLGCIERVLRDRRSSHLLAAPSPHECW